MENYITKMKDFYSFKPDARIVQEEFGFYSIDKWRRDGFLDYNTDINELFGYDPNAKLMLWRTGGITAPFLPGFEEKVLEDRGDHELVSDYAGRKVLYFKGRRDGFMPEYVDHPVKDMETWQKLKWRLNPETPGRFDSMDEAMAPYVQGTKDGFIICQHVIGGYMYLRSLIGPLELLYKFHDEPELIHDIMQTWFAMADKVTAEHQKYVTLDEIYTGEDICYKQGLLISPDMVREFLFPYYQQLLANIKRRQLDKNRKFFLQVDTDGNCFDAIDLYKGVGMNYMSPFEVAAGCDVVEIRKKYPDLLMRGGIDKRILAESKDAIDREIERIMPFMVKHGGYIPTCDHGVPEEVPFENYMHYRKRMLEF